MDRERLKEYLSKGYQGAESFLGEVVRPIFGDDFDDGHMAEMLDTHPEKRLMADATGIRSVKKVVTLYLGGTTLDVFDVLVGDRILMERNRVGCQRLIRAIMDVYSCAFMLFHYADETRWDWRFSFCHKNENLSDSTDSRRFTFLLGPGQSCRTAADNFMSLYAKRGNVSLSDVEAAFSVEALSKEFFGKYKSQYDKFVAYITNPANGMRESFVGADGSEKPVRDYVKRMMGRIVFLHFLQKKGWLGVPAGGKWGEGDREFMLHLFAKATEGQKADFLDSVLEPLFEALDTNRADVADTFDAGVEGFRDVRVPYLNGGLFERNAEDERPSRFPADYFGDLLSMFAQYNFTIDENDPDDAEVGVDPEMLGRIFENLLEDNKDKGAYYTPKEVVQYMCRESLTSYLQTDYEGDGDTAEAIRHFVRTHDPSGVAHLSADLVERLRDVKVCDPAIGSGAFPMGMLREIFLCRTALEGAAADPAAIKRHIIQENIYGVDIEAGAVEIARLRFWLSLVVDEPTPETLPNLDFKIMQGNSLLESYDGFDLRGIADGGSADGTLVFDDDTCNRALVQEFIRKYFEVDDHAERRELRAKIDKAVKGLIVANRPALRDKVERLDLLRNSEFFLWHTYFRDVFCRPSRAGFDIVAGNPPYGAAYPARHKELFRRDYATARTVRGVQKGSLDTFGLFIELGYGLLRRGGTLAYIVPIAVTSSDSMTGVHRLLLGGCGTVRVASFAVAPRPIFQNAVVNTSILFFRKTGSACRHLYSTKMYRRDSEEFDLRSLLSGLQFTDVRDFLHDGRIPKIGTEMEKSILGKLARHERLADFLDPDGAPLYYRTSGGRYFKVVTSYPTGSTKEKALFFSRDYAAPIGCALSSSLSFWFYQIYGNNLDWKTSELLSFTMPRLTARQREELTALYGRYLEDIEAKCDRRATTAGSRYNVETFRWYKIVRSKPIIDEIDDYIGPLYGLTAEEVEFVKKYELRFRMSGE